MAPWLHFLEAWMVQQLLRTPAFHRAVEKVARSVHRARHGIPADEMGGMKIDQPDQAGFLKHFTDEIRTQIGRAERQEAAGARKHVAEAKASAKNTKEAVSALEKENADAAWQHIRKSASEPPKQGFMAEYLDALREQVRGQSGRK